MDRSTGEQEECPIQGRAKDAEALGDHASLTTEHHRAWPPGDASDTEFDPWLAAP